MLREKSEAVDHSSQQEETEEGESAQAKSRQQSKKEENKFGGASAWEAEKTTEAGNEVSCEKGPGWPPAFRKTSLAKDNLLAGSFIRVCQDKE